MAHAKAIGILSQTLSPSPCVKWILPARIRSKAQNDVVFVGDNFVQLREALPNGRLSDVLATSQQDSHILAAKVVSAKHERIPIVEQILNQTIEDERERYIVNGEEIDGATPPQVIVLSGSANELIFLFAQDLKIGRPKFLYAKKPFLRTVSISERFGSQLAVDPESRAIAAAAVTGFLTISSLKQIDEIQAEVKQANSKPSHIFKPTDQDRFLQVDGLVQKMEFLPSTAADPNKILLLLLVSYGGRTCMLLYRWDSREGPKSARPMMCSGQKLPAEDSMVLMLIPSSRCPSFVIVTEKHIAVYDNVISDQAKRVKFPCLREVPAMFESSSSPPGWVAWAKPRRHPKYLEKHDDFYLVREDGELRYYVIDHDSPIKVEAHFSPGSLSINVDSAFAMVIARKELGADVFVAGGDLSDGGVWHCVARKSPVCVQVITNMAPLRDMSITGPNESFCLTTSRRHESDSRVFTCSGKHSRFSFVNEIRFGLEAEIGCSIEYEDGSTATNFWILEDAAPERALFLMSHPTSSSILSLDPSTLDVSSGDAEGYPGIDLTSSTLAAACTPEGLTIQICSERINISILSKESHRSFQYHENSTCIAAAIDTTGGCFVLATRSSEGFSVQIGSTSIDMDISLAEKPYKLAEEISAVTIVLLGDTHIVVAALEGGTLLALSADFQSGPQLLSLYSIQRHVSDVLSLTISSIEILNRSGALQSLVLCGLRSGVLAIVSMDLTEDLTDTRLSLNFCDKVKIGSTRIGIVKEQGSNLGAEGAFISCDNSLSRISFLDETGLQFQISPIWFTNHDNPSAAQPTLNAICRVLDHPVADINNLLVCASENEILIASVAEQDAVVPRKHRIGGPPEKMAYSKSLKKLVVALNTIHTVSAFQSHSKPSVSRRFQPGLQLVDPDNISSQDSDGPSVLQVGNSGDRIRAITEFLPTDGTVHFEFLAIGIDRDAADHHLNSGLLVFVTLAHLKKMPFTSIKPRIVKNYSGKPVCSLHPCGLDTILVGAGNDVIWEQFIVSSRKLITLRTFTLPSSATSLYAIDNLVYAATLHHSLITLQKNDNKIEIRPSDNIARNVRDVLILDGGFHLLNVFSGEGTRVIGLSKDKAAGKDNVLFDSSVPCLLEGIKERNRDASGRQTFDGIGMDGALLRFKILLPPELRLLRFLEGLFPPHSLISELRQMNLFPKDDKNKSIFRPTEMHVNGDRLTDIVNFGSGELYEVLRRASHMTDQLDGILSIKTEEQKEQAAEFKELAVPVVGDTDDLVDEVVRWLRALMKRTSIGCR